MLALDRLALLALAALWLVTAVVVALALGRAADRRDHRGKP